MLHASYRALRSATSASRRLRNEIRVASFAIELFEIEPLAVESLAVESLVTQSLVTESRRCVAPLCRAGRTCAPRIPSTLERGRGTTEPRVVRRACA